MATKSVVCHIYNNHNVNGPQDNAIPYPTRLLPPLDVQVSFTMCRLDHLNLPRWSYDSGVNDFVTGYGAKTIY